MKNKTPELLKFKRLHRRLGFRTRRETIGLLEALWIFAQNNARAGDVGRYTDDELAAELEWSGSPAELVAALVETGWLDRCLERRLLIHDWADHSPNWLKGVVAKMGGFPAPIWPPDHGEAIPDHDGGSPGPRVQDSGFPPDRNGPRVQDSGLPDPGTPDPGFSTQGAGPPYLYQTNSNQTLPIMPPAGPAVSAAEPAEDGRPWTFLTSAGPVEVSMAKIQEWLQAFRGIAVHRHLGIAAQWLVDHPDRRPAPENIHGFLGGWLSRHATSAANAEPPPIKAHHPDPTVERNCVVAGMVKTARKKGLPAEWIELNVFEPEASGVPLEAMRRNFAAALREAMENQLGSPPQASPAL